MIVHDDDPHSPPALAGWGDETQRGAFPARYVVFDHGSAQPVDGGVIEEENICLFVNGQELATFMCSPMDPHDLAFGFLKLEGFIQSLEDVRRWRLSEGGTCVDVWLNREVAMPTRRVITSGCGGGVTFEQLAPQTAPLSSALRVSPESIANWMKQMNAAATLYREVRGVHTSALAQGDALVRVAQDLGRHNTIDRLCGICLREKIDPRDMVLLTSGRISSEMMGKAAKMGVPLVVSRTSPTSLSVQLGQAWGITVIGYCRGNTFRVYTHPQRVESE